MTAKDSEGLFSDSTLSKLRVLAHVPGSVFYRETTRGASYKHRYQQNSFLIRIMKLSQYRENFEAKPEFKMHLTQARHFLSFNNYVTNPVPEYLSFSYQSEMTRVFLEEKRR
jgi:hypothetical protein